MNNINTWEELVEFAKGFDSFELHGKFEDTFSIRNIYFQNNLIYIIDSVDNNNNEFFASMQIKNNATYQQMADFIKIIGTKKG